jgi:hypothetical protein
MTSTFSRIDYDGPGGEPSCCDVAICRRRSGATVLFEDRIDNPGTIVDRCVDGLATALWRAELHDLDASAIRWFRLSGTELAEIRFGLVPESRGGFFGIPQWSPFSDGEGEDDHRCDGVRVAV